MHFGGAGGRSLVSVLFIIYSVIVILILVRILILLIVCSFPASRPASRLLRSVRRHPIPIPMPTPNPRDPPDFNRRRNPATAALTDLQFRLHTQTSLDIPRRSVHGVIAGDW